MQKLNQNIQTTKHLQFQIVEYSFNLRYDSITMKSQGPLRKTFRYDEKLRKQIFNHLDQRVKGSIQKRVDMINDPEEVLESLYLEKFNLEDLDASIKKTMAKLEFQLPDKLVVPMALFYFSNAVASKIQVLENNIVIEFDPRNWGFMSEKVQKMLSDINHPV